MDTKNINDSNTKQSTRFYPPVVAVLGHVDHGKTTLLDSIRKTDIAQKEHGGITQKIGASTIELTHERVTRRITFIDTPGHEAFSKMRGRGVTAADIGLLIVSSVDGVMPQTKESLALLRGSNVPFIVVITKIDAEMAIPEKPKQQLLKENVHLEGYGGDVPVIEVSAKTGKNINELLDLILLVSDLHLNLSTRNAQEEEFEGIIIESRRDPKAGPKATVIVKKGVLHIRDQLFAESVFGKVRMLINDRGKPLEMTAIGEGVEILGFGDVPNIGSIVFTKAIEKKNTQMPNATELPKIPAYPTPHFLQKEHGILSMLLSADTQGSLEAILASLPKQVTIVSQKIGEISEADILLAKSVGAIVIGFNTKVRPEVAKMSRDEKVLVKNYTVIYELLREIQDVIEGRELALEEKILGKAQILASFPFEKAQVLGVRIIEGRIAKGDRVKLLRGDQEIGLAQIISLRHGKDQISKVQQGNEAGVILSPFLDFTIGDMLVSRG